MVSANSSTSAGGLASAATGKRPTRNGAIHAMAAMSRRTRSSTRGRCTFTTTSSPLRSVAACTCAIDAAARHCASKRAKTRLERAAEVLLDDAANGVERFRRHLVAAGLELVDQLVGKQTAARGDDLAELDVGRSEPFEGTPQPARQSARVSRSRRVDARAASRRADADPISALASAKRQTGGSVRGRTSSGTTARALAQRVDVAPPREAFELDLPRRRVAEGPGLDVAHPSHAIGGAASAQMRKGVSPKEKKLHHGGTETRRLPA